MFIRLFAIVVLLAGNACASVPAPVALQNRTLRLSLDKAQVEYQTRICLKSFLGICTKTAMQKDTYDLSDPVVRQRLSDMGFVLKVRDPVTAP